MTMPQSDTHKTPSGCEGNAIVPARTKGVLGNSVKPRRADITKYISQISVLNRVMNAAMFEAVNRDGSER